MLNAILQHEVAGRLPPLRFQRWGRSFGGAEVGPPITASDVYAQDDYSIDLSLVKPGSVRTYDWEQDHVLALVLPRASFDPGYWNSVRAIPLQKMDNVGLIGENMSHVVGGHMGAFDLLAGYDAPAIAAPNLIADLQTAAPEVAAQGNAPAEN